MIKQLNLSVHDVVDLVLRKGSLDTRVFNQSSMKVQDYIQYFKKAKIQII